MAMIPKFRAKDEAGTWRIGLLTFMFRQYAIVNESDENTVYLIEKDTIGQYTGLKDKNGVEIFEGDILKNRRYSGIRVLFEKGAFKVRYKRSKVCIVTQDLSSLLEKYESTIIIGNIYENPELLEEL